MNRQQNRSRGGLTLLEVVISLILVSTIVLVSITASANLLRNKAVSMHAIEGGDLAFQILDEVTAVQFQEAGNERVFGRETDETATNRSDFDDVDDYHGYTASPPTHRDGTAIKGFDGWSFSVSVSPAQPIASGIAASSDDAAPLRLVTVTCTSPGGDAVSESMLVSEVPSSMSANISQEKWRRLTLSFPDQRKIEVTAPLRNQPEPGAAY